MKILHAPINIGNQPWVLSQYERKLGHKSKLIVNISTDFKYPADKVLMRKNASNISNSTRRLLWGSVAPCYYDVLHYYFGKSILVWNGIKPISNRSFLDIRLAKRLGKKVFFTLQGCDVRLAGESNKKNLFTPCAQSACELFESCTSVQDKKRQQFIEKILPLCDKVFYLNPELGHYLPTGNFLPYCSFDIHAIKPIYPDIHRVPKIVHAPTSMSIKGSRLILEALDRLRANFEFELILVENKTNAEALDIYRTADIAIDQVLAGWYGGVSVELMAMGKPVLCYIRDEDLGFVPQQMVFDLPIRRIRPDHLVEDIGHVLEKRNEWVEWGLASRRYVERWHNPEIIASALIDVYKDPLLNLNLVHYI